MSAERDVTRIVRSWLRTDEHETADRILDVVLDQLDATPQRRAWWPVRRFADMNAYTKLAIGVAAVAIVAVVGFSLVPTGRDNVAAPASPSPSPSVAPSAAPSASASGDAAGSVPGEFTACLPNNTQTRAGTDEELVVRHPDGDMTVDRRRGYTWTGDITATDERFSGRQSYSWDGDLYTLASGGPGPQVVAEGMRIENDQGAWQGGSTGVELPDGAQAGWLTVLTGEGAYAGLEAVMLTTDGACFQNYRGLVIEGPTIPVPDVSG
jgi:hypothetical protein